MTALALVFGTIVMLQPAIEANHIESTDAIRQLRKLGAELFFERRGRIQLQCISFAKKVYEPEELRALQSALESVTAESFQAWLGEMNGDLLRAVSRIRGLEEVMLLEIVIENDHLKWLTSAPRLKRLSVSFTELSALSAIEGNKVLLELDVPYNKIGDKGLAGLSRLAALEKLSLSGNKITDAGVDELLKCPRLKYLDLRNTRVTPAGIEKLVQLRHLEEIDLGWTKVDDASFQKLCGLQNLKKVHVDFTDVSDGVVKRARRHLPNLGIVSRP